MQKFLKSYANRMFLIFLSFSMVLLIVLCVIQSAAVFRTYETSLKSQGEMSVDNTNAALSAVLTEYASTINSLCEEESTQIFLNGNIKEDARIEVMKDLYFLKNSFAQQADINVVELKNNVWLTTGNYEGFQSNKVYRNWGVFGNANDSQDVVIYAFSKDAILKEQNRICLAKAYRNEDGEILGYVMIEISRSELDSLIKEYNSVYNTNFMLVNKTGSIIYHSKGTDYEGVGKLKEYGERSELTKFSKNELVWDQYICAYNDMANVYILRELPEGAMNVMVKILLNTMGICVVVILLFSSIFSKFIANSVSYPIRELRKKMSQMEQGDLSTRVEVTRTDEIGYLGESFNHMAERIETLVKNIDEEKHSLWIAETRSLNLQMNPHFLYNTLDLIKWNAKLGRNQEITDIAVNLGKLLRKVMNTKEELVPVSYELDIVSSFVELQKKRHGEKLKLFTNIQEDARKQVIPKLTLEPIIENAIVHGFVEKAGDCIIEVSVEKKEEYLVLTVQDNGDGMSEEELESALEFRQENTHHIGLSNVQRRARLYGDEHCGLTIHSVKGEGTKVVLILKQLGEIND